MRILTLLLALSASPAFAMDACLVGTWKADLDDLATLMGDQMGGEATITAGSATMQVNDTDSVTLTMDNLTYDVQVPDIPAMKVSVTGISNADMSADAGSWSLTATDYDLVASADVLGETMVIPVTSDTGMFGGGTGTYDCNGDNASFTSSDDVVRMPRKWVRVD